MLPNSYVTAEPAMTFNLELCFGIKACAFCPQDSGMLAPCCTSTQLRKKVIVIISIAGINAVSDSLLHSLMWCLSHRTLAAIGGFGSTSDWLDLCGQV